MSLSGIIRTYALPDAEARKLCAPDEHCTSVAEIDFEELWNAGRRHLVFDVDGTLTRYHSPVPGPGVMGALRKASSLGFAMCALSNDVESDRVKSLEVMLEMPVFMASPKKPHPRALKPAMRYFELRNCNNLVVVGDRLLTDILVGNRVGAYTILADPFQDNNDPFGIAVARLYERVLYRI
ncbi:YqeG family HAD IIIA-type phosphatase [Candidatus Woesearchaeota archaeon]|nr:YqeG family HAD IIIA-type phosphatase [Candidatus Woesearchaeota archaeon]